MCILFLYINPKPLPGQFRLVLAANRDEVYRRPSLPANYWEEDKTVIGGRDLETGKEGGTWLALSTRGRIAALLNIMSLGSHAPELLGRGSLVADFVKGRSSGIDYLKNIAVNCKEYRPFNFLTVEINAATIDVCEYSNTRDYLTPASIKREYLGISNSLLDSPFSKVTGGIEDFQEVIKTHGTTSNRQTLTNKLLEFLKSRKSYLPDPVMASYGKGASDGELKPLSSIYVEHLQKGYGTRAHSVITLDTQGRIDFSEWAMLQPIDPKNPQWESHHFSQTLNFEDKQEHVSSQELK